MVGNLKLRTLYLFKYQKHNNETVKRLLNTIEQNDFTNLLLFIICQMGPYLHILIMNLNSLNTYQHSKHVLEFSYGQGNDLCASF